MNRYRDDRDVGLGILAVLLILSLAVLAYCV